MGRHSVAADDDLDELGSESVAAVLTEARPAAGRHARPDKDVPADETAAEPPALADEITAEQPAAVGETAQPAAHDGTATDPGGTRGGRRGWPGRRRPSPGARPSEDPRAAGAGPRIRDTGASGVEVDEDDSVDALSLFDDDQDGAAATGPVPVVPTYPPPPETQYLLEPIPADIPLARDPVELYPPPLPMPIDAPPLVGMADHPTAPVAAVPVAVSPVAGESAAAPGRTGPKRATAEDLSLLRAHSDVRARCLAGALVPFLIYAAVMASTATMRTVLIWIWIPLISAGVLVGLFLDLGHRRYRAVANPVTGSPDPR